MRKNFFGPLMTLSLLTVVACNGGGGGGGSTPKGNGGGGKGNNSVVPTSAHLPASVGTINGVLLDSAVIGLHYTTAGVQATTGAGGSFSCKAGEVVRFEIGGIKIAEVPCLPVITPIELATNGRIKASGVSFTGSIANELSVAENNKLQRIASLLQSLDMDGNVANGITVEGLAVSVLGQVLDESDSTLEEALNDGPIDAGWEDALHRFEELAGGQYHLQADGGLAIAHFKSTLLANPACSVSDVAHSASVAGIASHCVALSCAAGYSVLNGACVQPVLGCMDNTASNYNASATQDDGSCIAASSGTTCLIGLTNMDSTLAYSRFGVVNTQTGGPISPYSMNRTLTLVVLNDGSSTAKVYRPKQAWYDHSDWMDYAFYSFSAYYALDSASNELTVHNIDYDNAKVGGATNDSITFHAMSLNDGATISAGAQSTGFLADVNDLAWSVSKNCSLPTIIEQ